MNDQTIELLRELSEKLGTTADHLWGVMLAQAPITADINTFICIGLGCAVVFLWILTGITNAATDSYSDAAIAVGCLAGIVTVVCLIAIPVLAYEAYIATHNPEFWALQQLLP